MSSARLSTRPEIKITIALGPSEGAVIASMDCPVVLHRAVTTRRDGRYYTADIRRARAALERRLAEYWKSLPMREVP